MEFNPRHLIFAAVAAFVAWGYITEFFPQLLFLPWALVAGSIFTVGGLVWILLTTSKPILHNGEQLAKARQRWTVKFARPETWETERDKLRRRVDYRTFPVYPESKDVSRGADALLELVIRDFVTSWYNNISRRPYFQNEVDRSIRTALCNVLNRILELDVIELVVSKFIPIITKHLHDFDMAERSIRGKKLSRSVTESDELNEAIANKYRGGKLHIAASLAFSDTKIAEQQHLRGIVVRLLPRLLPESMTKSAAVNVLIKEIIACAVLYPIVSMLSDPDFWNQQMEAYGRSIVEERKNVRKLRAALDEHAPNSPQSKTMIQFPRLQPGDNERRFERFIRAVNKCSNLSDARRFRSEIAAQLRKDSDVEEPDQIHIRRLEKGKRALDQKIAIMATSGSVRPTDKRRLLDQGPSTTSPALENASLRELLYNSAGLSSFMEYMDRQNVMRLVQFWIVVDGVKNPLDAEMEDSGDYAVTWTESDRADIAQINEAYLTLPEINASAQAQEAVHRFLRAGNTASPQEYFAARRAVLQTQRDVYEEMMNHHYPNFKRSDLYYKWLASDNAAAANVSSPSNSTPSFSSNGLETSPARPPRLKLPRSSTNNSIKKESDLRRAVASSSDLKSFVKPASGTASPPRRSLDDPGRRAPLFDDDDGDDPLARSVQSIDSEPEQRKSLENDQGVVDAMQAALTDIMDSQPDKSSLFSDSSVRSPHDTDSLTGSMEIEANASPSLVFKGDKTKPSLASLGLVGAQSTSRFLDDDLFGGEEQRFLEDEREDSDVNDKSDEDAIHEAAPGDLGLAEAIDALTGDIEKLVTQESIVDSLTNKAELTNNAAELRILRKSKASLQREINRKELQRQQYIVQESDNSLYGRATITIQSIMVGQEEDGKEFAMYVIEVRRQAGEQMPAAAWVVARRYSEFHELNKRLRYRYPVVRSMDFPRRQVVLKLQKDFLQKRKQGLERYLRDLLRVPAICRSRELRAFLSQQAITQTRHGGKDLQVDTRDFVTRIYNSVTDGMEEFLGNIPVLDQLSLAGQNLISAATTQLNNAPSSITSSPHPLVAGGAAASSSNAFSGDLQVAAEAEAELRAFESRELEPFVKPICDLFLEAFELNRESNWLRGRAVIVVLHQLLGSTVERKARDLGRTHLSEESVAKYLTLAKDIMWPGGKSRPQAALRTAADKAKSRKEAGLALASLVPELVGSVVGRANASSASRRFLAVINNRRLNTHLVFTMLDEIVKVVFDDIR